MIERRSDVVNGTESVAGAGWVLGNVQMEYQAPREPYVRHMLMGAGPGVSLQDRVRNCRNESMTDVRRYCVPDISTMYDTLDTNAADPGDAVCRPLQIYSPRKRKLLTSFAYRFVLAVLNARQ